ncbi:hypothetical protein KAR91_48310 [Candidatus Pacearchaeota archaeon]|nr:hypothetical protein [Candidatus Pacearchaeota archaeon]
MTKKELKELSREYRSHDGTVSSEMYKRGVAERNFSAVLNAALFLAGEVERLVEPKEKEPVYRRTREDEILYTRDTTDNEEMQNFEQHK